MQRLASLCRILFLLSVALPLTMAGQVRVSEIAHKVDERYNSLQTMKADFVESYRGAGMTRQESGTLYLKRPGRMRWDYSEPEHKLFIVDGKNAWFYVPGEQQVHKTPVKNLDDLRSPLRYLLGKTQLQKEFEGLSFAPDVKPLNAGDVVLRGVPKTMKDRIEQVLLEVNDKGQLDRIQVDETDGSVTEFVFRNIEENAPVASNVFTFKAPPGTEVVEDEGLAPQ
jgi:outer membrane lipoprotein carrier protein